MAAFPRATIAVQGCRRRTKTARIRAGFGSWPSESGGSLFVQAGQWLARAMIPWIAWRFSGDQGCRQAARTGMQTNFPAAARPSSPSSRPNRAATTQ